MIPFNDTLPRVLAALILPARPGRPTAHKLAFVSRAAAGARIEAMRRADEWARSYECPCGAWHLTRRPFGDEGTGCGLLRHQGCLRRSPNE